MHIYIYVHICTYNCTDVCVCVDMLCKPETEAKADFQGQAALVRPRLGRDLALFSFGGFRIPLYIYIYVHVYIHVYTHVYIYIYAHPLLYTHALRYIGR